ncbi:MAG: 3'-5' exonuclease [Saprospiraceae bacterium]
MNFIIFDIEATCWEGRPPSMTPETIEIGAVKMDAYGDVHGTFQRFIKPVLHPQLSLFCRQLTNISQVDINRARTFPDVINEFQDWIDIWEEDYLLCSWGQFDQRLFRQDCTLHHLDDEWTDPHINLKQQYTEIKKLSKARGLKKAVEIEGFEWQGDHHRALDDARNLAAIFRKYLDVWRY